MKLENEIESLSYDELLEINRLIVDRIKVLRASKTSLEMQKFNLGNKVEFFTDEGEVISGTVAKVNKKTVGIVTNDGERWNVSPTLLSLGDSSLSAATDQKIIDFEKKQKA